MGPYRCSFSSITTVLHKFYFGSLELGYFLGAVGLPGFEISRLRVMENVRGRANVPCLTVSQAGNLKAGLWVFVGNWATYGVKCVGR